MSNFHREYADAVKEAREKADRVGIDVAIRKVKEYGRPGYAVSFASRSDSDYALAEIVKPSRKPNPRKRRNPDAFQPGDVVHYVQGWDAKKHPTVTGTILQRYFRGDGDEWLVEAPSPYTGEMERTAVREEKLKHGPAPVKVLPFARANPRKRGNPAVKTLSGDAERARIWKRLHKLHADLRDAGLLEQAKDLNNRILRLEHAYPIRPAELRKHELDFRHALRSHRYWFQGGHAAGKAYPPVPAHDRRRNPDLSGALTISHEASGDVLIRHVAHNPRKRRNPLRPLAGEPQQAHMARWKSETVKRIVENARFWLKAGYSADEAWVKAASGTAAGPAVLAAARAEFEQRKNPARRLSLDKSSPKRRRNPSAAHAAPSVSAATLGKIARMTSENDHSGALLVLARDVLKSPTFAKKALGIQLAQNRAGYLTEALNTKRNALSARMFAQAKRRLSAADYALLRRSF